MATKRALCPYCGDNDIARRLFDVNPDATVCYCPHCMKELEPAQAVQNYQDHINGFLQEADFVLFEECNPALAYQKYAFILELEHNNPYALIGRMLCLLYMSKVRTSYIKDTSIMLESVADSYFHKDIDPTSYIQGLKKMNNVIDQYEEVLKKKLTFRTFFYDVDCLSLYIRHLYDIVNFKELLLKEARFIAKKHGDEKAESLTNLLSIRIDEQTKILKEGRHTVIAGDLYHFVKLKRNGEPELEVVGKVEVDSRITRYRMASLDDNNKNTRHISDVVFKDFTKMVKMNKASIWLFSIAYVLAAGCASAAAIMFSHLIVFLSATSAAAFFFIFATVFLVLHISWTKKLKNKRALQVL